MLTIAIICLFIGITICYFHDRKDALNGHINHSRGLKIKLLCCLPAAVLFSLWHEWTWWQPVKALFLTGSWFMFLFNGIWGLKVAGDFFYRSTAVGKNLAWTERIVMHWPKILYILFICGLCIASSLIYFIWK